MSGGGQSVERQLVQTLRGDLSLICSEARKRYPAVREVRNPLSLSGAHRAPLPATLGGHISSWNTSVRRAVCIKYSYSGEEGGMMEKAKLVFENCYFLSSLQRGVP